MSANSSGANVPKDPPLPADHLGQINVGFFSIDEPKDLKLAEIGLACEAAESKMKQGQTPTDSGSRSS